MSFKEMSVLKKILWILAIIIMGFMFIFFNDLTMGMLLALCVVVIVLLFIVSKIK